MRPMPDLGLAFLYSYLMPLPEACPGNSLIEAAVDILLDLLSRLVAKMLSVDLNPISNSLKLILASPSRSKRLKIAMISCRFAMCPVYLKNFFRLL